MKFDPVTDRLIYVDQNPLRGAVTYHLGDLRPEGINASDTPSGLATETANIPVLLSQAQRAFVIYHEDRRAVAKQLRSPVREYLGNRDGSWIEIERREQLSRYEPTELRVYQRK
jgi:hypothetical protein